METVNQSSAPGELSQHEQVLSTIESLMVNDNNRQILENLKMYHDAGRGSRISIFHENIEDSEKTMMMGDAVYNKMKALAKKTADIFSLQEEAIRGKRGKVI